MIILLRAASKMKIPVDKKEEMAFQLIYLSEQNVVWQNISNFPRDSRLSEGSKKRKLIVLFNNHPLPPKMDFSVIQHIFLHCILPPNATCLPSDCDPASFQPELSAGFA